jgi:hypothetical protein
VAHKNDLNAIETEINIFCLPGIEPRYIGTFLFVGYLTMSRDSVAGIATGYGLDDRGFGVRVPIGLRIFSSLHRPDRL